MILYYSQGIIAFVNEFSIIVIETLNVYKRHNNRVTFRYVCVLIPVAND